MEPRSKLWVEKDGKIVLSDYRVRLLRLVDETGSLAEAAQRMGLSYRRAWGKVKEIEENLGLPLLQSSAGGPKGGGSRLSPEGRRLVDMYERYRTAAEQDLRREFDDVFRNV
jgi:molybdate transport system regulatory protein